MCGSYDMQLSIRDNRKCRQLIQSDWFKAVFRPEWNIVYDQNVKSFYQNTALGHRQAVATYGRASLPHT